MSSKLGRNPFEKKREKISPPKVKVPVTEVRQPLEAASPLFRAKEHPDAVLTLISALGSRVYILALQAYCLSPAFWD